MHDERMVDLNRVSEGLRSALAGLNVHAQPCWPGMTWQLITSFPMLAINFC